MSNLNGQNVVVLGGTSGIGLATAKAAAAGGATVIATGRSSGRIDDASAQAAERLSFEQVDATDREAVSALLQRIGGADHILVTAGRTLSDPRLEADPEEQAEAFGSRFWSAVNVGRASARYIRPGGSVTFTSGVAAYKPIPGEGTAAAACAAVEALARQLATDMKPIRFNALVPGLVDTPMLRGFVGDNREQAYAHFSSVIPVGRIAEPAELAHAAMFLMENDYVNGIALVVDGGFRLT